ncbi:MAG: hypothetical protein A2624_06930 [Gammaproteobacteria bacterium RIFCSPHIGHO2_01_FULL_42_8]|nr:MAG: hypothetical protein A3B71_02555 [Gammaproteobacteria bacterium RIFCSPHIGHO2_02_FULL_42_43]OGT28889.1 MAG: hypothetical protein A2624_06930 [Gammaproteobacteria bacterium RIFCSPHIGHO2_01_FULL_42_8]
MHYGPAKVARTQVQSKDAYSVTVTNCSYQMENVYAWFTDGSSKEMPIYPANNYPMNIISIDYPSDYPYVYIEVTALDGTVLFPQTAEYPGAYVNIGCDDATLKAGKYPVVTVTK